MLLLAGILQGSAQAAPAAGTKAAADHGPQRMADYDSRESLTAAPAAVSHALVATPAGAAVNTLRDKLGVQGVVDIDRATGTPRRVAKLDGYLTAASKKKPADIALAYVAAHADVFGLDADALARLSLRQDYVDVVGTHHLSFVQVAGGVPVFGNGLKAHVAADGRLISLDGSPVTTLPATAGSAKVTAAAARAAAVADVFGTSAAKVTKAAGGATRQTTFSDGGNAKLVWFQAAAGPRLAWQTINVDQGYVHVVDADSGQVLYRRSTIDADSGSVFYNYPGAPVGGTQKTVNLGKWLPNNSPRLAGNTAHVYSDVNDDDAANPAEEVAPSGTRQFVYPFTDFSATVGGRCSAAYQCSWDPATPYSWQTNRAQNAVQMFYFLGTYHDHLQAKPIGFTRAAGNFEAVDGDAVQGQSDDGADIAAGMPDDGHIDNANMNTMPDGIPPVMQMYLFAPSPRFIAGNSGDDSGVVYHEYTHGLSNRLVVDAAGNSTLGGGQARSMGEAWGDWYGLDFLVDQGLETDNPDAYDVLVGKYVDGGGTIRSEPLDCTVGAPATACPGTAAAGSGGYTYGDFGRVYALGPEVHADGEIWGQTLWDLRKVIGSKQSESLVTRAMELSPANPSFLDMRNSILQADLVVNGGKQQKKIWKVFASRGMGYFAAAIDGGDVEPVEDFALPPAANTPRGALTGKVTDRDTGAAVAGLTVGFGGHTSGFAGDLLAVTGTDGAYTISDILPGTYAKVFAQGGGYDSQVKTLSISSHTVVQDWAVRKDWAASSGGGKVISASLPDYTAYGCGADKLIDQSQSSGWGSDVGERQAVLQLSGTVNISELVINPSATCGDDDSASTGGYRVETSPDGATWTVAATGNFPSGTVTPTAVPLTAGTTGVGFVRFTMVTTQAQDAGLCPSASIGGCQFMDSTELAVYGGAA
jgi:extracellular elastinolytic metalloproteinase